MCQYYWGLPIKSVVETPYGSCSQGGGPHDAFFAVFFTDMVHCRIEVYHFFGIVEEVYLVTPTYDIAEPDPYQSDQ